MNTSFYFKDYWLGLLRVWDNKIGLLEGKQFKTKIGKNESNLERLRKKPSANIQVLCTVPDEGDRNMIRDYLIFKLKVKENIDIKKLYNPR